MKHTQNYKKPTINSKEEGTKKKKTRKRNQLHIVIKPNHFCCCKGKNLRGEERKNVQQYRKIRRTNPISCWSKKYCATKNTRIERNFCYKIKRVRFQREDFATILTAVQVLRPNLWTELKKRTSERIFLNFNCQKWTFFSSCSVIKWSSGHTKCAINTNYHRHNRTLEFSSAFGKHTRKLVFLLFRVNERRRRWSGFRQLKIKEGEEEEEEEINHIVCTVYKCVYFETCVRCVYKVKFVAFTHWIFN